MKMRAWRSRSFFARLANAGLSVLQPTGSADTQRVTAEFIRIEPPAFFNSQQKLLCLQGSQGR